MKVLKCLFILLFVFSLKEVVFAEEKELLYYKNADVDSKIDNEIGVIILDADIYRNTDYSFANLRLYYENKKIIPYFVRVQKINEKTTITHQVPLTTLDFGQPDDETVNIVLENKDKKYIPTDLNIQTPNKNFEKIVSVYGSDNKQEWEILTNDQPIFDYSKFIDIRNTKVSFKKKLFKYYKVSINKAEEVKKSAFSQIFNKYSEEKLVEQYEEFSSYKEPFRVDRINFLGNEQKLIYGKEKTIDYPLEIVEEMLDEKENISNIYLNSSKQPLNELEIALSDTNFKRRVVVEASNDIGKEPKWIVLNTDEVFSIKAGIFHKDNLKINLKRSCRYLRYRLKINNQDNAPIKISSVKGKGPSHEILFFHNNRKSFRVYYGGDDFKLPKYDVSSVLKEIQAVSGGQFILGQEIENKDRINKKQPFLSSKAMLIIALVVMVTVLGYLLVFSVNKIDKQTKA